MGLSFSCPFSQYDDVENGFESIIVKSISLGEEEVKTPVRSVSFKRCDLDPRVLKSIGSEKMMVETSVSFKGNEFEETVLVKTRSPNREQNVAILPICPNRKEMNTTLDKLDSPMDKIQTLKVSDPNIPKHMAALKLQKVYKSFRTRRKLADCAVLVEQSWWKLLDFAELKRSSISFFEIEKHETAISRWSRARTRAAKVGKGLSKNNKAQKLALQHWLEAIDPRHRYGHNLHFYYVKWLHCQSKEPFFYWLDIGEGKEVNLVDKCHRPKLQQQCIKYLGPMERMAYEVVVEKGIFFYKQSREILDTTGESEDAKWIFVLSTSKVLYVGKKKKGTFQHSSFLAGGATTAAGRLVAENGILKAVWPHSGHYRPTEENFKDFVSFLQENNVDLSNVQMSPVDEDAISISKQRSNIQSNSSEEDLTKDLGGLKSEEKTDSMQEENAKALEAHKPRQFFSLGKKLSSIEIPKREFFFSTLENEEDQAARSGCKSNEVESAVDGYETAEEEINSEQEYMFPKKNLFDEENEVVEGGPISEESILKRINSHKGMKSFQLGKQLSCKWTTGAGPRIGCVRDYPWELQSFALEQVCLSPHNVCHSKLYLSPRRIGSGLSPKVGCGVTKAGIRNSCTLEPYRTQSSSILLTGIVNMF